MFESGAAPVVDAGTPFVWPDARVLEDLARYRHHPPFREAVAQSADIFKIRRFFLSDEFSLVDATIAPLLWRLPHYEIELPPQAQPILRYAGAVFSRVAFRESLSPAEHEMRFS